MSGEVKQDMTLVNKRADANEKMGHIFTVCGKKTAEVPVVGCGDIGAVSKLVTTRTGDTLSMSVRKVELEPIEFAPPCYTQAIAAKVKGAEEKISTGLSACMTRTRPSRPNSTPRPSSTSSPVPAIFSWTFCAPSSETSSA